jgi:hypothetical protein
MCVSIGIPGKGWELIAGNAQAHKLSGQEQNMNRQWRLLAERKEEMRRQEMFIAHFP